MSFAHKLIFDPFQGEFKLVRIPVVAIGGSGGAIVTAGVLTMPSGTSVECIIEVNVTGIGEMLIEPGSTLLVT